MCFQKLLGKKVRDLPKCVHYLTDLKIQNSWRSCLRNTDSVQDRGRYQYRKHYVRKSHVNTKRDFKKYLVAKLLKCFQLLRNDILFPTELLLNQTLSIFQTNWSFIHMKKLTVLLYYSVLILPKVIHFVNYMWHVQTQICSFYCCTFTRRHVIILYFMLLHERLKLDVHTMHYRMKKLKHRYVFMLLPVVT